MLDRFWDHLKALANSRFLPLLMIFTLLYSIIFVRLFNLQIVKNDTLKTDKETVSTTIRELKATRGRILDCNGVVLAENRLSYSVTIEDTGELKDNNEKNRMIYTLIRILDANKVELATDFFLIIDDDGNLAFKDEGEAQLLFKREVYSKRLVSDLTDEEKNAGPQEVYDFLKTGKGSSYTSMYGISDEYSLEDSLKIMQIRYNLMLNKYSRYKPITVAANVNEKVVAAINEYSSELAGVNILTETYRHYNEDQYFSHIIGYTGLITTEKMNELNEAAGNDSLYSATDQIGKMGLEQSMEEYLMGTKGYEEVILNGRSQVTGVKERVEPKAGNDIYLSIDSTLQKAVYTMLEKELASILLSKIINARKVGTYESASDIQIPVYDVYFALIKNGVIDIKRFSGDKATALERSVQKRYVDERTQVFAKLEKTLSKDNETPTSSLDEDMAEYVSYIYKYLKNKGVVLKDKINTEDKTYIAYTDGKISLSHYLKYAFSQNWINLDRLKIEEGKFYSTDELYDILLDYTFNELEEDTGFADFIYKILIQSDKLKGSEICRLLYIQNVIPKDEKSLKGLEEGTLSAYNFVLTKIKALEITPAMLGLDPCSGSVIVTDAQTGKIRAMVTYPSYDNNKLANKIDSTYYTYLLKNSSDILVNRATQTISAPGSTFKPLATVAGLEEGKITVYEKIYDKRVFEKVPGTAPKCSTKYTHGDINVVDAIGVSCNYFFYEVGYRLSLDSTGRYFSDLGLKKLEKYAKMFGFDEKSGVEISEHAPHISTQDSIRSAIGQGNNAFAPIQISRYATSLANSGKVFNFSLIDKICDMDDHIILNKEPEVKNQVKIRNTTWDAVHQGMYTVVHGQRSSVKKIFEDMTVAVAGKTGTAQQVLTRPSHALFISYAPYEDPEITVTVVIPFGYASYNAAELAGKVYQYYFNEGDTDSLIDGDISAANITTTEEDEVDH